MLIYYLKNINNMHILLHIPVINFYILKTNILLLYFYISLNLLGISIDIRIIMGLGIVIGCFLYGLEFL